MLRVIPEFSETTRNITEATQTEEEYTFIDEHLKDVILLHQYDCIIFLSVSIGIILKNFL
jgi:hypothetical protein